MGKNNPEIKVTIYTNEEKNKFIVDELCKVIAKSIYEKNSNLSRLSREGDNYPALRGGAYDDRRTNR